MQETEQLYSVTTGNPNGQALVLLHGWGMHSDVWQTLLPELEKDYRITLIDLPGLGRSDRCVVSPYDLDIVVAHLKNVAPETALWLGWSLGGIVAMAFAAMYPDRVTRLITLGSSPCFVERDDWAYGMGEATYTQFEQDLQANPYKTLQRFNLLQVQGGVSARADLKTLKQILSQVHPTREALVDSLALLRGDYRELYRNTTTRALHLLCELDTLAPHSMTDALKSLHPAAQTEVLSGYTHVGFISEPRLLAEKIRASQP